MEEEGVGGAIANTIGRYQSYENYIALEVPNGLWFINGLIKILWKYINHKKAIIIRDYTFY